VLGQNGGQHDKGPKVHESSSALQRVEGRDDNSVIGVTHPAALGAPIPQAQSSRTTGSCSVRDLFGDDCGVHGGALEHRHRNCHYGLAPGPRFDVGRAACDVQGDGTRLERLVFAADSRLSVAWAGGRAYLIAAADVVWDPRTTSPATACALRVTGPKTQRAGFSWYTDTHASFTAGVNVRPRSFSIVALEHSSQAGVDFEQPLIEEHRSGIALSPPEFLCTNATFRPKTG
jgi:hypothetical protein